MRLNSKLLKFKTNTLILDTTIKLSQNKKTQTYSESLTLVWWKAMCVPMVVHIFQWQWSCKHDPVITQVEQIGFRARDVALVFQCPYKNMRKLK